MSLNATTHTLDLVPQDAARLANLSGPNGQYLRQIEARVGVDINERGFRLSIIGPDDYVRMTDGLISTLYEIAETEPVTPEMIHLYLQESGFQEFANDATQEPEEVDVVIATPQRKIRGRGPNQRRYVERIQRHDLSFGIGPAGTGKTYLAVACAVDALMRDEVQRILLVRPAVEAGERLGFLPGDLAQKIDPYLRPLYDALYEMLGFEKVAKLIERNVIEVAPLAYMRGRTLNESFIILDEAQNTTPEQMKMFLTRIGFRSTVVVTGDVTQVDLPRDKRSGLREAIELLTDIDGISFTFFQARDVVRHVLVQRIVAAYDGRETGDVGDRR